MAEAKQNPTSTQHGDVDRVQMMSIRKDGTPDQSPGFEMIGDRETTLEQTTEQFRQRAVSAVDQAEHQTSAPADEVEDLGQDPAMAERQSKHADAAKAAEAAAVKVVDELYAGDDQAAASKTSTPAKTSSSSSTSSK